MPEKASEMRQPERAEQNEKPTQDADAQLEKRKRRAEELIVRLKAIVDRSFQLVDEYGDEALEESRTQLGEQRDQDLASLNYSYYTTDDNGNRKLTKESYIRTARRYIEHLERFTGNKKFERPDGTKVETTFDATQEASMQEFLTSADRRLFVEAFSLYEAATTLQTELFEGENPETEISTIDRATEAGRAELQSYGTVENYRRLVRSVNDWSGDAERSQEVEALSLMRQGVRLRLDQLGAVLRRAPDDVRSTATYRENQALYTQEMQEFAMLLVGAGEVFDANIYNAQLARRYGEEVVQRLSFEDAFAWAKEIDECLGHWKSANQIRAAKALFAGIREGLAEDLEAGRANGRISPERYSELALQMARLFRTVDTYSVRTTGGRGNRVQTYDRLENIGADGAFSEQMALDSFDGYDRAYLLCRDQDPLYESKQSSFARIYRALPDGHPARKLPAIQELWQFGFESDAPRTMEESVAQYVARQKLEHWSKGKEFNAEEVIPNTQERAGTFMQESIAFFLQNEQEVARNASEEAGLALYKDMIGGDLTNWSDESLNGAYMLARVGVSISTGIAIGMATGGLSMPAQMIAAGAAMTATNAVVEGKAVDSVAEGVAVYGTDLAVNAAGTGLGRALASGRYAAQLSKVDDLGLSGRDIFVQAMRAGGPQKFSQVYDDAVGFGARFFAAGVEGAADTAITSAIDTQIEPGLSFMEAMQRNAMFLGVSFGSEFSGDILRGLRRADSGTAQGLVNARTAYTSAEADLSRLLEQKLGPNANITDIRDVADLSTTLRDQGVAANDIADIALARKKLRDTGEAFRAELEAIAVPPDFDSALTAARAKEKKLVLDYFKRNPDISEQERRTIAEALVDTEFTDEDWAKVWKAHASTDAEIGKLTTGDIRARVEFLKDIDEEVLSKEQRRLLIEAGVCGHAARQAPPPNSGSPARPSTPSATEWKSKDTITLDAETAERLGFTPGKYTIQKAGGKTFLIDASNKAREVNGDALPPKPLPAVRQAPPPPTTASPITATAKAPNRSDPTVTKMEGTDDEGRTLFKIDVPGKDAPVILYEGYRLQVFQGETNDGVNIPVGEYTFSIDSKTGSYEPVLISADGTMRYTIDFNKTRMEASRPTQPKTPEWKPGDSVTLDRKTAQKLGIQPGTYTLGETASGQLYISVPGGISRGISPDILPPKPRPAAAPTSRPTGTPKPTDITVTRMEGVNSKGRPLFQENQEVSVLRTGSKTPEPGWLIAEMNVQVATMHNPNSGERITVPISNKEEYIQRGYSVVSIELGYAVINEKRKIKYVSLDELQRANTRNLWKVKQEVSVPRTGGKTPEPGWLIVSDNIEVLTMYNREATRSVTVLPSKKEEWIQKGYSVGTEETGYLVMSPDGKRRKLVTLGELQRANPDAMQPKPRPTAVTEAPPPTTPESPEVFDDYWWGDPNTSTSRVAPSGRTDPETRRPNAAADPQAKPKRPVRANQEYSKLSPELTADMNRAKALARDPNVEWTPTMMDALAEVERNNSMNMYVHTKTGTMRREYTGYARINSEGLVEGNYRQPIGEVEGLIHKPDKYPGHNYKKTIESVRMAPASNGNRMLVYRYESKAYLAADRMKRRGSMIEIAITVPREQAERLFEEFNRNPQFARSFFIAAGQRAYKADYIWDQRTPPFASTDDNRHLAFVDEDPPSGKGYEYGYQRQNGDSWEDVAPEDLGFDRRTLPPHNRRKRA